MDEKNWIDSNVLEKRAAETGTPEAPAPEIPLAEPAPEGASVWVAPVWDASAEPAKDAAPQAAVSEPSPPVNAVPYGTAARPVYTAPYYNGVPPQAAQPGARTARGDAPTPWRDPAYQSVSSVPSGLYSPTGGSYGTGAPSRTQAVPQPVRKRSGKGLSRFLAMALVCILLSACTTATVLWIHDRNSTAQIPSSDSDRVSGGDLPTEQDESRGFQGSVSSVPAKPTESSAPSGTAAITATGEAMDPTLLYEMACQQVVGVNLSVTTNNIFGQNTATAVSGTGFIISEDGYILTNYHVIEYSLKQGYDIVVLLHDESEYPAELVGYDEDGDLAVLKINASGLNPAAIGSSENLRVGQTIYTVGNPLGELTYTMTDGIVSALNREISTSVSSSLYVFQINAAVNSGNSGGPVYDAAGRVVGVVDAKYSDTGVEGLSFALPIDTAYKAALEIMDKGYVSGKAYLGITGGSVRDAVQSFAMHYYGIPDGVLVSSVEAGGAADRAGVKKNDIITAVDGSPILSLSGLKSALRAHSPGDQIVLSIYRLDSEEHLEITVTLDERVPQNADN